MAGFDKRYSSYTGFITRHSVGLSKVKTVIDINHLTKDYGSHRGVFDVSLHVEPGEVYGYLGPNGAGKSTTLRHIMGFSHPDAGSISVRGAERVEGP